LFDVALDKLSPANRKVIISMRDVYDCIIRKIIRRGQEKGLFMPCNEKVVGFMISSMITRSRIWFQPKKGLTVQELEDFIFRFTLRGIQASEGVVEELASCGTMNDRTKQVAI
jgi:hypothetical protein